MRVILAVTGAALLLAGCQSEQQIRQTVRDEAVRSCNSQAPQAPGLDVQRFCNCLADRLIQGRSLEEIRGWAEDKAAQTRAGVDAGTACAREQMGAAAGAGQQAAETGNEAAEEAGDEAE